MFKLLILTALVAVFVLGVGLKDESYGTGRDAYVIGQELEKSWEREDD